MMKNNNVRFGRNIMLSVLFVITICSLAGTRQSADSIWSGVHAWSGGFLLLGSGMHLLNNRIWMKNVLTGFKKKQANRVRLNFFIDLGLLILGILCALSGGLAVISDQSLLQTWSELHRLSGFLMAGLMTLHILLHWQSMTRIARSSHKSSLPLLEKSPVASKK